MDYQCFQTRNSPFMGKLNCIKENGERKIFCSVRKIFVKQTPEELVRQSLLIFLIDQIQRIYHSQVKIEVERGDLDIVVNMMPIHDDFSPTIPPLLIIETKRKDISQLDSAENEQQLITYLKRRECNVGVLFNCTSMFYYQRQSTKFEKTAITDLIELEEIIDLQIKKYTEQLSAYKEYFFKAVVGEFNCFKELVKTYGTNSTIKFSYERDGTVITVSGFLFKVENNNVYFRLRGIYTRKRQYFKEIQFRNLISIQQVSTG